MRFCRNSLKSRWPTLIKSSRYRKGKCDFVEIHWNSGDPSGRHFQSSRYRKGKWDFVEIHWNSDNVRWSDWEPLIWWWLLNWTVDDDCVTRTTKTCLMSVLALIKLGLDLFRKNINRKRHKPRSKSHISVRNEEVIALNFWPKNGSRSFLDLRFRILAFAATNVWMREGP